MIKVAVNGFGRIGGLFVRAYLENWRDKFKLVAVNASGASGNMPAQEVAHRLKYDSNYGRLSEEITALPDSIVYFPRAEGIENVKDGGRIIILGEPDAENLPWKKLGVDVVVDCTGEILTAEKAEKHLKAGAKMVILSAPPKDDSIPMFVYGVNHADYKPEMKIISSASCTTNALAPLIQIIGEFLEIDHISFTTVHAYTNDQRLTDGKHKDPRRARRAPGNIIPTKTGAAKNIVKLFPGLKEKIDGLAYRVDTPTVSLLDVDFVFTAFRQSFCFIEDFAKKPAETIIGRAKEGIKNHFLEEIVGWSEEQLVSSDFAKDGRACVIDVPLIKLTKGRLSATLKIPAWYDNEWGYVAQLGRLLHYVINKEMK